MGHINLAAPVVGPDATPSGVEEVAAGEDAAEPDVELEPKVLPPDHYLTHKPAFPKLCEACRRAKMKQPRSFKGAFDREVKEWGDILTMDHLVSIDKELTVGVTWGHGCSRGQRYLFEPEALLPLSYKGR